MYIYVPLFCLILEIILLWLSAYKYSDYDKRKKDKRKYTPKFSLSCEVV